MPVGYGRKPEPVPVPDECGCGCGIGKPVPVGWTIGKGCIQDQYTATLARGTLGGYVLQNVLAH